ncbi:hypothetical protein KO317_03180 [Candidatus Micrarchaeota archaeon]|nr:hypothetical protein [Candidatus Micrarchaeota archaeon]
MKIILISSRGGHFKELMRIASVLDKKNNIIKVTVLKQDTKNKADYYISDISRNFINFLKNFIESLKILTKLKPDIIISTGSGTTLNFCIFGKILTNSKIIYVDSVTRVTDLSLCGKIIYTLKISDKLLIQWPNLQKKYPKTEYWGRLF